MPHAVVYIVDNPARVHTGKRIRTRRGVVWIAWTPTVEDARAVAGINDVQSLPSATTSTVAPTRARLVK